MYERNKVVGVVERVFTEAQDRRCVLSYYDALVALESLSPSSHEFRDAFVNVIFGPMTNPFAAIMIPIIRVVFLDAMTKSSPSMAFIRGVIPALGSLVNARDPAEHRRLAASLGDLE